MWTGAPGDAAGIPRCANRSTGGMPFAPPSGATALSKPFTTELERGCPRQEIGGIDDVSEFELDANFHRNLRRPLDDVDPSIDERQERLVGLLNRLEPTLLAEAAEWTDEEIAKAFLEFARPDDWAQETRGQDCSTPWWGRQSSSYAPTVPG